MQVFDNQGNLKQKSLVTSGVNSVTATPPLFSTGGSAPDISITLATALSDGYLSSADWSTFNGKQNALTLTTVGSSGSSTLVGATLNIPTYTLAGLGGVPTSRQLTINGTTYDLSADRTWTINTLPSQTGNNGRWLTTDGTNASWQPLSGNISAFTNNVGYITLSSISAGTGINYNNLTGVITNSAPDQTVVLTSGTGISATGTYPNFTITNTAPDQVVALTAGTGISVSGTYPNFTITNSSPSPVGAITGSGTTNYLSKWTSSSALGNSLLFDNSTLGNVGINTSSPASTLEIYKSTGTNYLYVTNGTSGTLNGVVLRWNSVDYMGMIGNFNSGEFKVGGFNASGYFMTFYSNNAERMRLTPSGRLLIGTSTESTYLLDVSGTLRSTGTATFSFKSTTLSDVTALFGDNLGVNTGTSRTKVVLGNTSGVSEFIVGQSSTNNLLFNWTYNATAANAYGVLETYAGNNPLVLQSAGGNVGIGTTSPTYKLDVNGTARVSASGTSVPLTVTGANSTNTIILNNGGPYNALQLNNSSSLEGGAIGWGNGSAASQLANSFYFIANRGNVPTVSIRFAGYTGSVIENYMTIVGSTGNVQIGTTTDAGYKLDVNGTGNFNGQLRVTGSNGIRLHQTSTANQSLDFFLNNTSFGSLYVNTSSGLGGFNCAYNIYLNVGTNRGLVIGDTKASLYYPSSNGIYTFDINGSLGDSWGGVGRYLMGNAGSPMYSFVSDTDNGWGRAAADQQAWTTNGVERMRLNDVGALGIGTSSPNASALLDVSSTTKGVLFPRMTTTQKNAITTPATGLVIFDTTLAKLCVYTGSAWETVTSA